MLHTPGVWRINNLCFCWLEASIDAKNFIARTIEITLNINTIKTPLNILSFINISPIIHHHIWYEYLSTNETRKYKTHCSCLGLKSMSSFSPFISSTRDTFSKGIAPPDMLTFSMLASKQCFWCYLSLHDCVLKEKNVCAFYEINYLTEN